jgi:N utilization substance protein B
MFRVKYCREVILKLLYVVDVQKLSPPFSPRTLIEDNSCFFDHLTGEEMDFIVKIIQRIFDNQEEINQWISRNLIGWDLDRLTPIDRNLIRMGISEMHFNRERAIVIDDIIRISKKYSEKDSFKLINAMLDKVK